MISSPAVIGVFDSGIGGLSVVRALAAKHSGIAIDYCCDTKNFPYGTKSEDEVTNFVLEVVEKWKRKQPIDLLVIACNTASTVALKSVRASWDIPVVGVVPAIKPAAQKTQSKVIGLLATPATISRPYTHELISNFAQGIEVLTIGSSRLVAIAEEKLRGITPSIDEIKGIIAPFFLNPAKKVDHIIIGCTHFSFLLDEFRMAIPWEISFVDPAGPVAERAFALLPQLTSTPSVSSANTAVQIRTFYTTQSNANTVALLPFLAQSFGVTKLEEL